MNIEYTRCYPPRYIRIFEAFEIRRFSLTYRIDEARVVYALVIYRYLLDV